MVSSLARAALVGLAGVAATMHAAGSRPPAHTVLQSSPSARIQLTLSEGTSMAAALSPDGRTIVIDLVGALWTLGREGGRATRILDDGYDAHAPSWSPDGTRIAFQAYRDNTWSIWTINRDGSGLQRQTASPFDDREPHWSPDGLRIAFSSDRGGNYDIWTVTLATKAVEHITSGPANEGLPAWSPDGREIAYVSDRPARGVYAVAIATKAERVLQAEARTSSFPSWHPDGKRIAYAAFEGATSRLMAGGVNIADAGEDVFPFRPQWSGDEVVYTADGKIKARPASGGAARVIDFAADISFTRPAFTPTARAESARGEQPVRGIMRPAISPDGSRIAFAALGDLWLAPSTAGEVTPERLTNDPFVDTEPAWSPDGAQLAFSSDRDGSMDLWLRDMKTGRERKLASRAMSAAWSPDGGRVAFLDPESQLQIVDVATGDVRKAHDRLFEPGRPSWLPGGRAVVMGALRPYSSRYREGTNQILLVPIDLNPGAPTTGAADRWFNPLPHKSIGLREDFGPAWSPDGKHLAAIVDGHLVVLPIDAGGAPLGKSRQLSRELANAPSWTRDSRQILYQHAEGLSVVDVATGNSRRITPRLSWSPAKTAARTVIHAGRLFDGRQLAARTDVDLVIDGNRIARIEPHHVDLHDGTVVDASNGTVLPGLIESHTHLSKGYGEVLGRIFLAFGITSIRNPAANAYEALEDREAIDAGVRTGPRVFATGEPLDGTRIYYPGASSTDDDVQVDERLARAQSLGFAFVKTYVRLPDLLQKRVIEGAHRMGLPVTSHELYPAVAYGADGVEHIRGTSRRGYSPKMSELRRSYRDVIDLLTRSGMTITPTIVIQGGFPLLTLRDGWWLDDPRLRLFPASASEVGRALRSRGVDPQELTEREAFISPQERLVAEIVKGGGRVIAGTDAPINPYGVSLLAEIEHYVRGGLSPAEAIRTATAVPAEAMGLGAELGTLEPGKLADLVVVDGDPLTRIADLRRTRYTIKDGVVYSVDELLRGPRRP